MIDTFTCPSCEALYITAKKASELSGFAESTIRSWVREGLLEPVGQIGNNRILTEDSINTVLYKRGYDLASTQHTQRGER